MTGPGKYDDLCTHVREQSQAVAAIVIIVEGNRGNGFSAQMPAVVALRLPSMLRQMADQIEQDANALKDHKTER